MALKKMYELDNGFTCEYHTPIIMQDNKKNTRVAISSFKDETAYKAEKAPLRSRVDAVSIDSKYPTAEEIYAKIKESRLEEVTPAVEEQRDEEGNIIVEAQDAVTKETNFYADAEDLI
jgi:hypothetical protein